jgi:glycyl-tRNA synthetase (class II)
MVKDVKNGQGFRADKLITEWIENKINKDKNKLKEE